MAENKGSKVLKAGVWYTIVNFLTKGAIFLTTPIFTRLMSTKDIGAFSNVNSWYQVLLYLVTFNFVVTIAVARFDYKDELDRFTSSILVYGTIITGIIYCIIIAWMDFFSDLFSMQPYSIHIIFIYMLVYPALLVYQSRNMIEYKYKMSATVSIASIVLSIGTSLLLINTMEDQLLGRLIGNFIPVAVLCLVIYIMLLVKGHGFSMKYLGYAVKVAFPMIWHSIAIHLLASGDRIVITRILGEESNALYSVAFTTGIIAAALWDAMNNAWSPWSQECMDKGNTEEMKKASRPYIGFFAIVVFGMLLVSPEILYMMGGSDYMQAVYVLPPVIVGCLCQFIYSLYVNAEFYLKKQTRIAFATLCAAGLNIGLNFIFIPKFGYIAAAYTTLFGYLFLFLVHFLSLYHLGKKDWYDNRYNIIVICCFLLMIPFFNFLYQHSIVRYCIIGLTIIILLLIMVINKEYLLNYVRRFLGKNEAE